MANILIAPKNLGKEVAAQNIWERYLTFCDAQKNNRFLWFALALFIIPCFLMPLSFYIIFQYSWYVYLIMPYTALLFANILGNILEFPSRITISIFFITILFNIVVPAIAVLL